MRFLDGSATLEVVKRQDTQAKAKISKPTNHRIANSVQPIRSR